jgi:hypothetical protein
MAINAAVTAPALGLFGSLEGIVTLAPVSVGRVIDLGTDTPGDLGLIDLELDEITAGMVLRIGSSTNTGGIVASNTITRHTGYNTLDLITAGDVSQSAPLSVANLAIQAGTGVTLANAANAVDTLAVTDSVSGVVQFSNTGALSIGTLDGVAGVSAPAAVIITAASPLTVSSNVMAVGDINLTAAETASPGDDLTVDPGITVQSTGGNVTLQAGDNVLLKPASVVQASGTVTLDLGFGDLDGSGGGPVIRYRIDTMSATPRWSAMGPPPSL